MLLKVVLSLGALGIGAYTGEKSRVRQEKKKADEEKKALDRKESIKYHTIRCQKEVLKLEEYWEDRFGSLLVIDSNIWMEPISDKFFDRLEWVMQKFSSTITMSSIQFDEIINLKNLPYKDPRSQKARGALAKIEYFQKQGLITIITMQIEAKKYAYADPDIIKFLIKSSSEYSPITLVSDDRELRIRTNQIMKDQGDANFLSITGNDLDMLIAKYEQNLKFLALHNSRRLLKTI